MKGLLVTMDIATLIASISGVIALIVAIWAIKQNSDLHRRQMNAEVFMKYAERYEQIMSGFPQDAFCARFSMSEELPSSSPALKLSCSQVSQSLFRRVLSLAKEVC
jgi:hypothetical protein